MILGDIYQEQIGRYEFASNLVSNTVLNITKDRATDYFNSKLLLRKNTFEIINLYQNRDNIEYTLRRKGKNNSIEFEILDKNYLLEENSFDAIIAFEIIQHEKNQSEALKKFFKLLKKDGVLIISTINKDVSQGNHNLSTNEINNELDRLQFLKVLKESFSEVNLFSQNIPMIDKTVKINSNIRASFHKLRLKFFMSLRMHGLYRTLFNDTIASKTNNDIANFTLDIKNTDYFPKKYVNGDQPLYFVAVCRK